MTKSLDQNWIDWEAYAFGYNYGSGEGHIFPALKTFLAACPMDGSYDYKQLETALTPTVAWLLINRLCAHDLDMLEYGTSPRFGWLTDRGKALKQYLDNKTAEQLYELMSHSSDDHHYCTPDYCNCGPQGFQEGVKCNNPFWNK